MNGRGRYYSGRRNSLLRRTLTTLGRRLRMQAYHSIQEVPNGFQVDGENQEPIQRNIQAPYSADSGKRLEL